MGDDGQRAKALFGPCAIEVFPIYVVIWRIAGLAASSTVSNGLSRTWFRTARFDDVHRAGADQSYR